AGGTFAPRAAHHGGLAAEEPGAELARTVQGVMRRHGLRPGAPTSVAAAVEVVTPHNVPPRLLAE
ncbi:MAG TPA: hypothetical protein VFX53_01690, partial [Pedococcus sp.]|nr:hypothetical protein [Pedococcus sp.]